MLKDISLYFHINPVKNHIFYVGIGGEKRPFDKSHRNKIWKSTVKKYGFIIDIIETGLTWEEAKEKEKFYIKYLGRKINNVGNLVNITDGGEGANGMKRSEKHKEAIRKAHTGKIISSGSREKMSLAKKDYKPNFGGKQNYF